MIPVPWLLSVDGAGDRACALTGGIWISSTGFAGGEREELLRTNAYDRSRVANLAEVLICGNAGIREDLGASSRNSGLPQKPASSQISSRRFPGESKRNLAGVRSDTLESMAHMREDMHKVVVERERGGSTRRNRKWGKRLPFVLDDDYEDEPKFVSSGRRRQYGSKSKWFTDVLSPLEGFLRSKLGRPWDKVYSELRQGLDVRKVTGRHIFDHLESMVETDCRIGAAGEVFARPRGWVVTGFYVHPRSRLLCFAPRQSARKRKKERLLRQEIDEIRLDRCRSYKLLDGQWYFVVYENVDISRKENRLVWDVVQRQQVRLTWGTNRVAIRKRQCSHEEVLKIQARIAQWKKEVRRM